MADDREVAPHAWRGRDGAGRYRIAWTGIALTDPRIGSVMGWADTLGNMKKQYDIDPWGQVAGDTGVLTRHRMAGREYDQESGLYYMRARYYSPEIGRFLSEDPIGIAGGLNLYAYSGNDPVNNRDPSGTDFNCYRVYSYIVTYDGFGDVTSIHESGVSGPICSGSISLPSGGGPNGGQPSGGGKYGGGPAGSGQADPCKDKEGLGRQYVIGVSGIAGGISPLGAVFVSGGVNLGFQDGRVFIQFQAGGSLGFGAYAGVGMITGVNRTSSDLHTGVNVAREGQVNANAGIGAYSLGVSGTSDGNGGFGVSGTPLARVGAGIGAQLSAGPVQTVTLASGRILGSKCK